MPRYEMVQIDAGDNPWSSPLNATDHVAALAEALEALGAKVQIIDDSEPKVLRLSGRMVEVPIETRRVPVYKKIVTGIYQQDLDGKFYFQDETEDLVGPYDTLDIAKTASEAYGEYLNGTPES